MPPPLHPPATSSTTSGTSVELPAQPEFSGNILHPRHHHHQQQQLSASHHTKPESVQGPSNPPAYDRHASALQAPTWQLQALQHRHQQHQLQQHQPVTADTSPHQLQQQQEAIAPHEGGPGVLGRVSAGAFGAELQGSMAADNTHAAPVPQWQLAQEHSLQQQWQEPDAVWQQQQQLLEQAWQERDALWQQGGVEWPHAAENPQLWYPG